MTEFRSGAATDIGQVRQNNQDSILDDGLLFAVADGMGGHRGGEIASHIAIESVKAFFAEPQTDALVDAVQRANDAIVERADEEPGLRGMGTTICAMALVDAAGKDRLGVVNVGDSRLYLLARGNGSVRQITEDHSLVETLVRQGQLTPEEAAVHPHRNILTRALGIDAKVMVDSWEVRPVEGDRYVICSDGLFNEVSEDEMAEVMRDEDDPQQAAERLVEMANAAGGRDNVSVVIVHVVEAADEPEPAEGEDDRIDRSVHGSERLLSDPEIAIGQEAAARRGAQRKGGGDEISGGSAGGVVVGGDHAGQAQPAPETAGGAPGSGMTLRVVLFVAAFAAIIGIAALALAYFANSTFYVAYDGDQVAIFRGRPGGLLWIQPSVEERTGVLRADVPAQFQPDLDKGKNEPTLEDAKQYVTNIKKAVDDKKTEGMSLGGAAGGEPTVPSTTTGTRAVSTSTSHAATVTTSQTGERDVVTGLVPGGRARWVP